MPYSKRSSTRYSSFPANVNVTPGPQHVRSNYKSEQTAVRRHEFISKIPGLRPIDLGDFAQLVLCRFKRSFGAGADDPPTPTASNNYQSTSVFNGSAIRGFTADIKLSNVSSGDTIYIDVYSLVYSFSDSIYQDAVYDTSCPVFFDTSGIDVNGETKFKVAPITWTENNFNNFKGLQRNIRLLGTVALTSEDGGSPNAEFTIRGLPAKCRRSQTGMFYGLMFHYGASKNTEATQNIESSVAIKFEEIPSSERVPFVW